MHAACDCQLLIYVAYLIVVSFKFIHLLKNLFKSNIFALVLLFLDLFPLLCVPLVCANKYSINIYVHTSGW